MTSPGDVLRLMLERARWFLPRFGGRRSYPKSGRGRVWPPIPVHVGHGNRAAIRKANDNKKARRQSDESVSGLAQQTFPIYETRRPPRRTSPHGQPGFEGWLVPARPIAPALRAPALC